MDTKTLARLLDDVYCRGYHSGKVVTDSGHEYIFDISKKDFVVTDTDGMLYLRNKADTNRHIFIPCAKVESLNLIE